MVTPSSPPGRQPATLNTRPTQLGISRKLQDESEALEYVGGFLAGWKSTVGAVAWVRAAVAVPRPAPKAKGPGAAVKKLLHKLPPAEVWQCDSRPLPNWVTVGGEPLRPWATLVTTAGGQILGHHVSDETPTPAQVWDALAGAMRKPLAGRPRRPVTLHIRPGAGWENLRPHLEDVSVAVEAAAELGAFDAAFALLAEHVGGDGRPGLLEAPGVTPDRVRGLYDAAAEFFRQAPWKRVGYECAIRVACDRFEGGPWFGVLMGQSGLTVGLALYEDVGVLRRMWAGAGDDEANARETVATSVTFNDPWDVPTADLDAATAHGWPVARPDAYPEVIRKERGMSMRSPRVWELELVEACLRAVPEFVRRRAQDDPTGEVIAVPTAGGVLTLALSWVTDVDTESPAQEP